MYFLDVPLDKENSGLTLDYDMPIFHLLFKASKDMSAYQAQRKKVDQDHKELTSEVTTLQSQLKSENADSVAERLGEIQVGGRKGQIFYPRYKYREKIGSDGMSHSQVTTIHFIL